MTPRTFARVLLLALVVATFGAQRSLACSCGVLPNRPGNCHDLRAIGPSFVGTVIDIEIPTEEWRPVRYHFRVDENISGFEEKEVDVYSGRGGADCSYHFRMGESYFVAPGKVTEASRLLYGVESGQWEVEICGGTQPAATAGALLAELRARKRGSFVVGVLRQKEPPYGMPFKMPGVTVELRGQGLTLSSPTDSDGAFRFDGIPAGTYQLTAKLPPDYPRLANMPDDSPPTITITEQSCYAKDLYALPVPRATH